MGLRFRKSINVLPGVRINFGLHGLSATIGPRGASVNLGPRGTYLNVGVPGTGVSLRTRLDNPYGLLSPQSYADDPAVRPVRPETPKSRRVSDQPAYTNLVEFKSVDVASLGTESLTRVRDLIRKLQNQRALL